MSVTVSHLIEVLNCTGNIFRNANNYYTLSTLNVFAGIFYKRCSEKLSKVSNVETSLISTSTNILI